LSERFLRSAGWRIGKKLRGGMGADYKPEVLELRRFVAQKFFFEIERY
jgi:hypothetical protein